MLKVLWEDYCGEILHGCYGKQRDSIRGLGWVCCFWGPIQKLTFPPIPTSKSGPLFTSHLKKILKSPLLGEHVNNGEVCVNLTRHLYAKPQLPLCRRDGLSVRMERCPSQVLRRASRLGCQRTGSLAAELLELFPHSSGEGVSSSLTGHSQPCALPSAQKVTGRPD